jgi:hypothetical protein
MKLGKSIKTITIYRVYKDIADLVNKMDLNPSTKEISELTWRIVTQTINFNKINEIR